MSESYRAGQIRFFVEVDGREEVSYQFDTISEAVEKLDFIKDFFPNARFIMEPVLH